MSIQLTRSTGQAVRNFNASPALGMTSTDTQTWAGWRLSDQFASGSDFNHTLFNIEDDVDGWGMSVGNSTPNVVLWTQGGNSGGQPLPGLSTGQWFHIGGVFNQGANTIRIFFNGAQIYQDLSYSDNSPVASPEIHFGMNRTNGNAYDGQIAEDAVWNTELSATEFAALAAGISPLRVRRSNLVGYWPHTSLLSNPGPDYSGNGTTLSLAFSPTAGASHPPVQAPFGYDAVLPAVPAAAPSVTVPKLDEGHLTGGLQPLGGGLK